MFSPLSSLSLFLFADLWPFKRRPSFLFLSSFYVTPFLFSLPPFSPLMVMVSLPSSWFLPSFSIVSPSSFLSHPAPKKDFECPSPFLIDIARRKKDEEKREEGKGWHFPIRLLLDLPSNAFVKEVREMLGECTGLSSPLSCMYQLI